MSTSIDNKTRLMNDVLESSSLIYSTYILATVNGDHINIGEYSFDALQIYISSNIEITGISGYTPTTLYVAGSGGWQNDSYKYIEFGTIDTSRDWAEELVAFIVANSVEYTEVIKTITTISGKTYVIGEPFKGATSSIDGDYGWVPSPSSGDQDKYLKGDGTWANVLSYGNEASIAAQYDSTQTYAVGDLCFYDHVLYVCSTAIDTAEEWDSTHWTVTTIDNDKAPKANPVFTGSISMGRQADSSIGYNSVATGTDVQAIGPGSHAEGNSTIAYGEFAHVEGVIGIAKGNGAHVEGGYNVSSSNVTVTGDANATTYSINQSISVGCAIKKSAKVAGTSDWAFVTNVSGTSSPYTVTVNETLSTSAMSSVSCQTKYHVAYGLNSHVEGAGCTTFGVHAHAEGAGSKASGVQSHAEGTSTIASGTQSHAEGAGTIASNAYSHSEGLYTTASGVFSHAEGNYTTASGDGSHAEGYNTYAMGIGAHVEGGYSSSSFSTASFTGSANATSYTTTTKLEVGYLIKKNSKVSGTPEWAYITSISGTSSPYTVSVNQTLSTSALSSKSLQYRKHSASGQNSHAEGLESRASGNNSHAEGNDSYASGNASHAEGAYTKASGDEAHAEGISCEASGFASHSEGASTKAIGSLAHSEGSGTLAYGTDSHAEGLGGYAYGVNAHIEGYASDSDMASFTGSANATTYTTTTLLKAGYAIKKYKKVDGTSDWAYVTSVTGDSSPYTVIVNETLSTSAISSRSCSYRKHVAYGANSHAEGSETVAYGTNSHAEGESTAASGTNAHAEGKFTVASASYSHAEGYSTEATNSYAHAEGYMTKASGSQSHAEGSNTKATQGYSHAEGYYTEATGYISHAEGDLTKASAGYSHAEGSSTTASGTYSHAEGKNSTASASVSHAEGQQTTASGTYSHAEGYYATVTGEAAHAEGYYTIANGSYQHVGGIYNVAGGCLNYPEWIANTSYAVGNVVCRNSDLYVCKTANSDSSFTSSKWTLLGAGEALEIIGNGSSSARSNARELDRLGNERLMGDVYVGCNADSTGGTKLAKITDIPSVTDKADKVASATNGNFAGLDANGNLTDSGHNHSDYLSSSTTYVSTVNGNSGTVTVRELPAVTSSDNDKVLKVVSGSWAAATASSGLPAVTSADNGKVLTVVNGEWAAMEFNIMPAAGVSF